MEDSGASRLGVGLGPPFVSQCPFELNIYKSTAELTRSTAVIASFARAAEASRPWQSFMRKASFSKFETAGPYADPSPR